MDQYIGRVLDDRYEILECIGTGGMAIVYKARCHRLNRMVAIKILKDEYSGDEEFRRRFRAEGEAVAMLSHPNIVQVYDVSSSDNANFIVMELIDGITLKQYMETKGTLNWKETLHFAMQIATALEHAHSRGIVHRDIKPHNVMVLKNGSVKVTDFGIARVMSKTNTLTKEALGSVHYISPEQAKGSWVDNRSDLYSLGVVMYEMMTGRPPYDGESPVAVAIQHINGGAALPSSLNPNIPRGLEQIIMKCMALDVADRYDSATELLHDLEEFRKNPEIIFGNTKLPVDDATRVLSTQKVNEALHHNHKTVAEKTAEKNGGEYRVISIPRAEPERRPPMAQTGKTPPARKPAGPRQPQRKNAPPQNSNKSGQTRQQIRQEIREEERNRMATIAVVACSAVAIIAILVFLFALVNGALVREQPTVKVPYLIGQAYDNIGTYEGIRFEVISAYSSQMEKGQILKQNPEAGKDIAKGSAVTLTVSLGPEPVVKVMEDLTNMIQKDAENFLIAQGMTPLVRTEPSDLYEEGKVIRTHPVANEKLEDGQTVYLYVSTGPVISVQKMPSVIGQNYATAVNVLNQMGFKDVTFEPKDSDRPKDEVLNQSVKHNSEIDVTTRIVLTISSGSAGADETTQATTQPLVPETTEAPETTSPPAVEETKTVTVGLELPADRTEECTVGLYQNGRQVIEERTVSKDTTRLDVTLTGSGTQNFDVYINGVLYNTVKVDFSGNE